MAVDFASQLFSHANERMQAKFNENITRAAELRKAQTEALFNKINETDPEGNPVLDQQGVADALDQIQKLHGNNPATKDLVTSAKDVFGKLHGLLKAPPQVRQQLHDHVMQIGQKLANGDVKSADLQTGGEAGTEEPSPFAAGPASPQAHTQAVQVPKTPTTTPAQEAAINLPAPPTSPALAPPPSAQATAPQPTQAPVPPPTVADILARGRTKMTPAQLYANEQNIAHKNALDQAEAQGRITRENTAASQAQQHTNRIAEIQKEVELRKLTTKDTDEMGADGLVHTIRHILNPTTQEEISKYDLTPNGKAVPTSRYKTGWTRDDAGKVYSVRLNPATNQPIPGTENYSAVPPAALLPTIQTHQFISLDENGNPQTNTLESTSQKQGINGVSTGGAGTGAGAGTGGLKPPPTARGTDAGTSTPTTPTGPVDARGKPLGLPVGANATSISREIPITEAYTQLVGTPDHPDFPSLRDYAGIADDPKRSAKLGNAITATLNGIEAAEKAHGTLMNLLQYYAGSPQALIAAQVAANKSIIDQLDPELMDAYNTTMAAYGSVIGIRALNKSSAAEFSTKKLENEVPLIGINAFDRRSVYGKLAKLMVEVETGAKKTPTIDKKTRQYIFDQVENMNRLGKGTAITPPPAASKSAPPTTPTPAPATRRMIDVQIPGQSPGQIPEDQWGAFKAKHPTAKRLAPQ